MHFGDLVRHFDSSPEKVGVAISGPKTGLGDNYYYYAMVRHAPDAFTSSAIRSSDPDGGDNRTFNSLTSAYPGALGFGYLLFCAASLLMSNPASVVLATSILHTMLLAFALLLFLDELFAGSGSRSLVLIAGCAGMVFVDAFALSVWLGRPYFNTNLLTIYSNTTRIVSPTLYWVLGLLVAKGAISVIRGGGWASITAYIVLSAALGFTSLAVGATLLAALGLYLAADLVFAKRLNWTLAAGVVALGLGLAWGYWQIHLFQATPLGQEVKTGSFVGFRPNWHCLVALVLVPWFWKFGGELRSFLITLVVASVMIGFVGNSFHLGDRLWVRGAAIFAWGLALYAAIQLVTTLAEQWFQSHRLEKRPQRSRLTGAALLLGLFFLVFSAQKPDPGSWKNFVDRDVWTVVEWVDEHIPEGSVVATVDPEFSYLLPVYTSAKPLFSMFGLTSRSSESELLRYFFATRLYGKSDKALADIASVNAEDTRRYIAHVMGPVRAPYSDNRAEAVLIMELVLYHSYNKRFDEALKLPEKHREFVAYLEKLYARSASLEYSFDYAIIAKSMDEPPSFRNWPVVFENGSYRLLKRTTLTY